MAGDGARVSKSQGGNPNAPLTSVIDILVPIGYVTMITSFLILSEGII